MVYFLAFALLSVQAYATKIHTAPAGQKDGLSSLALDLPSFGLAFGAPHHQAAEMVSVPAATVNTSEPARPSLMSKFSVAFSAPHHESSSSLPVTALNAEGTSSFFGKSLMKKLKLKYGAPAKAGALHQDPVATAVHGATSWLHRLMFGAPHHQEVPTFIQLHETNVRTPVLTSAQTGLLKTESRSTLMSKLGSLFGAPTKRGSFHENAESTAARSGTSWIHRSAFGAPHLKPTSSFLASHEAVSQASFTDSWAGEILAILSRRGDYHMSAPLRVFYHIFVVVLILITIVSFGWMYKETPGNKQQES